MLTLDEVRKRLEPMNLRRVAQAVGLHSNVLYRLMSGKSCPSYDTVKKLSDWLENN